MKKAFIYALKKSLPVLVSFFPVGIAYGILMQKAGYNFIWTGLTSIFVYAGALQYLMISFFAGGVSLITVAVMALLLNSRHIFYGIPFIDKWKNYKASKLFLTFALPDEAFALHISNDFDEENEKYKKWSYIFSALLIYLYWIVFSIMGALIGELITISLEGLDFALTALFIVILIDQIRSVENKKFIPKYLPLFIAVISSIVCLILFGASNFILPSLAITVALLLIFKNIISVKVNEVEANE